MPKQNLQHSAPESHFDALQPIPAGALAIGDSLPVDQAVESVRGDSLAPKPRPWQLGYHDRGLGRGDYAVLDRFGEVVIEKLSRKDAELIIAAVNAYKP